MKLLITSVATVDLLITRVATVDLLITGVATVDLLITSEATVDLLITRVATIDLLKSYPFPDEVACFPVRLSFSGCTAALTGSVHGPGRQQPDLQEFAIITINNKVLYYV